VYDLGIWLEVTTLIVPGQNDSPQELTQIAEFLAKIDLNIPWHISRFFPQYKMPDIKPTPIETLKTAYKIGKQAGLKYVYVGNLVDSGRESTYCPQCKKIIIKRTGYKVGQIKIDHGKCAHCGERICGVWE
jgi:pyruvate formate lyase activating enzyme